MNRLFAPALIVLAALAASQSLLFGADPDEEQGNLSELKARLRSKDTKEAIAAVTDLRGRQTDAALNVLIDGLRLNVDDRVKIAVIDGIVTYQSDKALKGLIDGYRSCNNDCKEHLIEVANKFDIPGWDELILLGLNDHAQEVQVKAAQIAKKKRTKKVLELMLRLMAPKNDRQLRKEIIASTWVIDPSEEDITIVKMGLKDKEYEVRKAALEKLALFKGPSNEEKAAYARQIAFDSDRRVRIAVAKALGKMVCDDSFKLLVDMLHRSSDDTEIETIGSELKKYQGPEVVELVGPFVAHNNTTIREVAVRVLAAQEIEEAKPFLVRAIRDKENHILIIALEGLKKYKDPGIIEEVMRLGKGSKDKEVREKIVDILLEMPAADIKEEIPQCLDWVTGRPLYALVELLGRVGDKDSARAIYKVLDQSRKNKRITDPFLAVSAARAFRLLGGTSAENGLMLLCDSDSEEAKLISIKGLVESQNTRSLNVVVSYLSDKSPAIREEAVHMLGMVPRANVTNNIVKAMDDKNKDVRIAAIRALGYMGDPKLMRNLIAPERLEKIKGKSEEFVAVIEAVSQIGGPTAANFLLERLEDDDTKIVYAALEGLRSESIRGNKEAESLLLKIAESNAKEDLRSAAISALGYVGGKDVFDKLLVYAVDRKFQLTVAAAEAIAVSGDPRATKELLALLGKSHRSSREGVVSALVLMGDKKAIEPLADFIRKSKQPYRAVYLRTIAHLQDPKVTSLLVEDLSHSSEKVVLEAVHGLLRWHDNEGTRKAVLALLQKENALPSDDVIRMYAAARRKEYVPALIGMLGRLDGRRHEKERQETLYALRCITNNDRGDDAEAWSKWWQGAAEKSLDEIVLDGFAFQACKIGPEDTVESLLHCALGLYSDRHHIRLNALRRLTSAAGEEIGYVDAKLWNEQIAEKWYRWWVTNKPELSKAGE